MALKPCRGCGREVDTSAKACPGCGKPHPTTSSGAKLAVFAVLMVGLVAAGRSLCSSVSESIAQSGATQAPSSASIDHAFGSATEAVSAGIDKQVLKETAEQYAFAKTNGSAMDACVHAGFLCAAFMQAKDADGFKKCKAIERADCKKAGIPRPAE